MKDFDVDFYDFLYLDFIDWSCDTVEGAHLNYYGGQKITDYLGNLLSEQYSIPDRRNDSSINDSWNRDYILYDNDLQEFINETYDEYVSFISTMLKEMDVDYYDFNLPEYKIDEIGDDCFKDRDHLNSKGAQIYSNVLADLL